MRAYPTHIELQKWESVSLGDFPLYQQWLQFSDSGRNAIVLVAAIGAILLLWLIYGRWLFPRLMAFMRLACGVVPDAAMIVLLAGKALKIW
jgi:hypothetical protein